jgi:hypothetical protein
LCPNCHAVVHLGSNTPRAIEEMQGLFKPSKPRPRLPNKALNATVGRGRSPAR